jgi:hypothetical protein
MTQNVEKKFHCYPIRTNGLLAISSCPNAQDLLAS